jgi:hypothetical protein
MAKINISDVIFEEIMEINDGSLDYQADSKRGMEVTEFYIFIKGLLDCMQCENNFYDNIELDFVGIEYDYKRLGFELGFKQGLKEATKAINVLNKDEAIHRFNNNPILKGLKVY